MDDSHFTSTPSAELDVRPVKPFILGVLEAFSPPAWFAAEDRLYGDDWWSGRHYVDKAVRLEAAGVDFMFFLDTLAVRRREDGSMESALRSAATAPQHDPLYLLPVLAHATSRIGLIGTASTTFYNPYQLARAFSTLDSLTDGRIGWNIVTSYDSAEARNFGIGELPEHDQRYDRADEFVELTKKLWEAWEPGALVADVESDTYVDASKVHNVDHDGQWFKCQGPLNTLRSPQGVPFLAQAGASPRGRDFAAKHAELTFAPNDGSIVTARAVRDDIRKRAEGFGRNPDHIKIIFGCSVRFMPEGWDPEVPVPVTETQFTSTLEWLSQGFNLDLTAYPLDEPFPVDTPPSGVTSMFGRFIDHAKRGLTLRETVRSFTKGRDSGTFIGTPEQVADQMIAFMDGVGGDGIMITSEWEYNREFVDLLTNRLTPALLRAGAITASQAEGSTLRETIIGPSL